MCCRNNNNNDNNNNQVNTNIANSANMQISILKQSHRHRHQPYSNRLHQHHHPRNHHHGRLIHMSTSMAMTGRQGWADRLRSVSFSPRNELFTPSIHLYVFYFFTQPFDAMLQYAFKITKLLSLPCSFIGLKILNHLLSLSWKLHPQLRV